MATPGYSGKPLVEKLGIKPGMKLLLINPPENYVTLTTPYVLRQTCKQKEIPDLVHLFVKKEKEFIKEMNRLKKLIKKNSSVIIWVSWYKKASRIPTDITEDTIRMYALKNGLVDIKVCAVSELWSGLKLVVPVAQRG